MSITTEQGNNPWSGQADREWHDWMVDSPPRRKLIRIKRPEWLEAAISTREEVDPEFNVCGVYWQLTGIANEDK